MAKRTRATGRPGPDRQLATASNTWWVHGKAKKGSPFTDGGGGVNSNDHDPSSIRVQLEICYPTARGVNSAQLGLTEFKQV
eukprot:359517-Chlamydomonas_euryale.AAC.35